MTSELKFPTTNEMANRATFSRDTILQIFNEWKTIGYTPNLEFVQHSKYPEIKFNFTTLLIPSAYISQKNCLELEKLNYTITTLTDGILQIQFEEEESEEESESESNYEDEYKSEENSDDVTMTKEELDKIIDAWSKCPEDKHIILLHNGVKIKYTQKVLTIPLNILDNELKKYITQYFKVTFHYIQNGINYLEIFGDK